MRKEDTIRYPSKFLSIFKSTEFNEGDACEFEVIREAVRRRDTAAHWTQPDTNKHRSEVPMDVVVFIDDSISLNQYMPSDN
uniref:Uncharacterized protein n=1 Tax=Salix viminalis TaxID=40686 RepID=A0A6N2L8Y5_SALVM